MILLLTLSVFYSFIVIKEEQKWEKNKWTDLMNSGN